MAFDPNSAAWLPEETGNFDPSTAVLETDGRKFSEKEVDAVGKAAGLALSMGQAIMPGKAGLAVADAMLTKGGRVGDIAASVLFPLAGSVAGGVAGGPVGAIVGGAAGGAAGDALVQAREMARGEREDFSAGQLAASTAVSAFVPRPVVAAATLAKTVAKTAMVRGAQGAILGGAHEAIKETIDPGEYDLGRIASAGAWGAPFGAAFGALEKVAPALLNRLKKQPPEVALKTLAEEPERTPEITALQNEIEERLGVGRSVDSAEQSATTLNRSAGASATAFDGTEMSRTAADKIELITAALKDPDVQIRYNVWPREYFPNGESRVAQIDLPSPNAPKTGANDGNWGSTNPKLVREFGIDLPEPPESLRPGSYTLDEIKAAIAAEEAANATRAADFSKARAEEAGSVIRENQIGAQESIILGEDQLRNQLTAIETRPGQSARERNRISARLGNRPSVDDGSLPEGVQLSPQAQRTFDNYGFATAPVVNALGTGAGGAGGFLYGFSNSEDKSPEGRLKNALATGSVAAGLTYGAIKGARGLKNALDEQTLLKLRQKFEDDWIRVRKLSETAGVNVSDEGNPYQKYRLMPGRVGVAINNKDEFAQKLVGDITKSAKETGIEPKQFAADVNGYLQAVHAPERNAVLGDGAAGMTNQQAADALAAIDASPHSAKVKEFAETVQGFNELTLDVLRDGQVITPELYAELRERYPNHVPLNRIVDEDSNVGQTLSTRGLDVKRSGIIKAKGSDLPVDDILGNVLTNYEQAVIRAEKNRVNLATLKFARDNPDLELFTEVGPAEKADPSVLELREGGEPTYLKIEDPDLAPVLKSLEREKLTGLLKFVSTYTRLYSGLSTRFNPEFALTNKLRDLQETAVYLASKPEAGFEGAAKATARDTASISDVFGGLRGADTPGAKLYRQMREDGGTTGGMGLSTREVTRETLDSLWKTAQSPGRRGARAVVDFIDDWNTVIEDSTRLSIYKQALDGGASRDRAAFLAKEGTIDFNRMGTAGPVINSLYAFSNASIQGSAKMLRAMQNPKVAAAVIATVGAAVGVTNEWNDSIDPKWREKVSKWDRINSLNVVLPGGDGIRYIALPVSYGLKPIKVAADATFDAMRGDIDAAEAFVRVGTTVAEGYNPVGGTDVPQALTPTILDTVLDLSRNKTSLGSQIKPDSDPFAPDSTRYFPSLAKTEVGRNLIGATKDIAEKTKGRIEISPADLNYILSQATGGAGRFAGKVATVGSAVTGDRDLSSRDVPFVSRVYRDVPEEEQNRFRKNPDLDRALTEQSRERFYSREKAQKFIEDVQKLPTEARAGALNALSDEEYDTVVRVASKQATPREVTKIKMLSPNTGARALFIRAELMKLAPENRQAYYDKLDEDGVIDDETHEQLMALLSASSK